MRNERIDQNQKIKREKKTNKMQEGMSRAEYFLYESNTLYFVKCQRKFVIWPDPFQNEFEIVLNEFQWHCHCCVIVVVVGVVVVVLGCIFHCHSHLFHLIYLSPSQMFHASCLIFRYSIYRIYSHWFEQEEFWVQHQSDSVHILILRSY